MSSLREKFEQDRGRIAALREKRGFNPLGGGGGGGGGGGRGRGE